MKKCLALFSILFLFIAIPSKAVPPAPQQTAPRLYINNTTQNDKYVLINYEITYGGYVEIHLFDTEGQKIWIHGQVAEKIGDHTFRIPVKPLKPGSRYTYFFRYKGEEYSGSFYAA
ncbi:MAG: hypothetical protein AAGI38_13000 [Bacteroidota bacterium]